MHENKKKELGAALGKLPSGLFILTMRRGAAQHAFLASWVMQAGFEPPSLSVAIKQGRPALEFLDQDAPFAVHIVPEGDKLLVKHFARGFGPDEDPMDGLACQEGRGGVALLPAALAVLECRVRGRQTAGDHVLVLGEILSGRLLKVEGKPLVHLRKNGFQY